MDLTFAPEMDRIRSCARDIAGLAAGAVRQCALGERDGLRVSKRVVCDHRHRLELACREAIADHRPVGDDLEMLVVWIRIAGDLESIVDALLGTPEPVFGADGFAAYHDSYCNIAHRIRSIVRLSTEAVLNGDGVLARAARSHVADTLIEGASLADRIKLAMQRDDAFITAGARLILAWGQLSRVARILDRAAKRVVESEAGNRDASNPPRRQSRGDPRCGAARVG